MAGIPLSLILLVVTLALVALMHLQYFNGGLTLYGMQGMVVTDPLGHLLAFFAHDVQNGIRLEHLLGVGPHLNATCAQQVAAQFDAQRRGGRKIGKQAVWCCG